MPPRNLIPVIARKLDGPVSGGRMRSMEGIRGFSALIVFLVHFHALFSPLAAPGSWWRQAVLFGANFGQAGVDVFFVLSGYLIYRIVLSPDYPGIARFTWRRLARVYPAYLAMLALYIAASLAFESKSKIPSGAGPAALYLLENLFLLSPFLGREPMILVSWSLTYEIAFYLSTPLLCAALGLRRWPRARRIGLLAALALLHLAAGRIEPGLFPRAVMFLAGALLREISALPDLARRLTRRAEWAAIALGLAALAALGLATEEGDIGLRNFMRLLWLLFPAGFFCVLFALFHDGVLNRLFSRRWLRWVGNASYSYYLMHGFALHGLLLAVTPWAAPGSLNWLGYAALLAAGLAVTLAAALALFLLVEEPFSLARKGSRAGGPATIVS